MTQTTALLLTLLIETPVVLAIVYARNWAPGALGRMALVCVGASLLTHPLLWLAGDHVQTLPALLAAELLIALVESVAYAWAVPLGWARALFVSCAANGTSLGLGLWLAGWL